PVPGAEPQVRHHGVEDLLLDARDGGGDGLLGLDLVAQALELHRDHDGLRTVVFDQQDSLLVHLAYPWAVGSRTVNAAPCPGALSISIRPPWARTMRSAIASPKPVP